MLIKFTKSSKAMARVESVVDDESMNKVEHIGAWGRAIDKWIDIMLSQVTYLLSSSTKLIESLDSMKSKLDQTLHKILEELQVLEKDYNAWLKRDDSDLDVLVQDEVIPTRSMYIEQHEAKEYKMNTLEKLIKDLWKV